MIREHDGDHGLGDRNESRQETRIVPALGANLGRFALAGDGVLFARKTARRLHGGAEHDRHAGRDAAKHAAVAVGLGDDLWNWGLASVTLSGAKGLRVTARGRRFFAALRMTGSSSAQNDKQSAQRESNPHFRHGETAGCRYIMSAQTA